MKTKNFTMLMMMFVCLFTSHSIKAQSLNGQQPLSTQQSAARLAQLYEDNPESDFSDLNDLEFWSILREMGSTLEVVYKPANQTKKIMNTTEPIDLNSSSFIQARTQVNNILATATTNNDPNSLTTNTQSNIDNMILYEDDEDPYLIIKTDDPNVITALRSDPNVDYIGIYSAIDDSETSSNDTPTSPTTTKGEKTTKTDGTRTTEGGSKDETGKETTDGRTATGDGIVGNTEGVVAAGGPLAFLLELFSLLGLNGEHGCSGDRQYPSPLPVSGVDYIVEDDGALRPWHFDEIGVNIANEITGGEGVKIAILDTGLSSSQENLNDDFDNEYTPRYISAKRTYRNDGDSTDDNCGHGTRMTATAAAPKLNGFVRGAAYRANVLNVLTNTDVMILKSSEFKGVRQALKKIRKEKPGYEDVDIISMSFGYLWPNWGIKRQIKKLEEKGVLMFAAAGTSPHEFAHNTSVFPGRLDQTICVTGVFENFENDPKKCTKCHQGSKVDFVVPLEKEYSGDYERLIPCLSLSGSPHVDNTGGSSAATATMAGVAALVMSEYPNASADQVVNMLKSTATYPNNKHDDFGWGQVDVSQLIAPVEPPSQDDFTLVMTGPQELIMDAQHTFGTSIVGGSGNFSYTWHVQIPAAAEVSVDQGCVNSTTTPIISCPFTIVVNENNPSNYADITVQAKDLTTNVTRITSRRVYVSNIIL